MYLEMTRFWVTEMHRDGKLHGKSEAEMEELARQYAVKLEEFFNREIAVQMEAYGKRAELERMLLYDTQYLHKYLNQTIPGYPGFRHEIFEKAKKMILREKEK